MEGSRSSLSSPSLSKPLSPRTTVVAPLLQAAARRDHCSSSPQPTGQGSQNRSTMSLIAKNAYTAAKAAASP